MLEMKQVLKKISHTLNVQPLCCISSSVFSPPLLSFYSLSLLLQSYMEDHLKNKDRLEKEWEALCAYQAEPNACTAGMKDGNAKKNRSTAVVACKKERVSFFSSPCFLVW